ncbi:Z1 domain-containing protein [Microbulbifer sp. M83]|uniref:Z1 domain-containing protein n=1 Tax=Microbulbifer sp. M83 TaxID=3118246 RepID=UPI002FE29D6E
MAKLNKNEAFYDHFLTSATFPYSREEQNCIERTVEKLLDKPTLDNHPGMLLGKIQSGKTKTFLAIMGLAFDNSFDVSVILTKGTKALSKQTLQRVHKDFKPFVDDDELLIFDIMNMPEKLTGYELKKKLIIIVKKQKDNLNRLISLFENENYNLQFRKTLLIDDEADYASVGYNRKDGAIDANLTAIRLDALRKKSNEIAFLQVTATPYSLYLQPEEISVKDMAFKPVRPAFTELVPVNDAYIGSDFYFDEADNPESLANKLYIPLEINELCALKKPDRRRLKKEESLISTRITGLRSAFVNFLVGGAIRQLQIAKNGEKKKKLSFLVHTEVSKAAHNWQQEVVDCLLEKMTEEAIQDSAAFNFLINLGYAELSTSIQQADVYLPSFEEVKSRVREGLKDGEVLITAVNSDKQVEELLDDSGQLKLRTPWNIFIGGQILDRGVTIGNLIGFYYGRSPSTFQQDTVLQHSRMYGYRPREDLAVTRFYTAPAIYNAMKRMHESDAALRKAIEANPDQEVRFIQGASSGTVIPCSPNKILLSETTTLRPYKRIIPVGFQTDYKVRTLPITEKIDAILDKASSQGTEKKPFKIPVKLAHEILELAEQAIIMSTEEGYTFDWRAMHSAIDYMTRLSSPPEEMWCLWLTNRNNNRLAKIGSHTRYVATPDTATTEGKLAKDIAKESPMLVMFRQNGAEDQGWRGTPFYWPLLYASGKVPTTIYANEIKD